MSKTISAATLTILAEIGPARMVVVARRLKCSTACLKSYLVRHLDAGRVVKIKTADGVLWDITGRRDDELDRITREWVRSRLSG